ncbi:MAG: aspartate dehydrogenase [Candidatus Micrarchaeia archaeon]
MKLRISILGCGAIGRTIAEAIRRKKIRAEIVCAYDKDALALSDFCKKYGVKKAGSIDELMRAELIIEAASQEAVQAYAKKILERCDMLIMSVGALLEKKLMDSLVNTAEKNGTHIYIPSGAVCGLDAVKAASLAGIERISLTTTKNPRSLGISSGKKKIVFRGDAKEAVKKFPKNINVAATLMLAANKNVVVEIVADPNAEQNIHEITVEGKFGRIKARAENAPFPENPKTSYIAALSAVQALKNITEVLRIA